MEQISLRPARLVWGAALLTICACRADDSVATSGSPLEGVEFDTLAVVGVLEGDPSEVFSRIRSVALAPDGRFAVLDDRTPMLALFDAEGTLLGAVTASGQGPGELGRPWEVLWTHDGDLLVLDPSNRRISRFRPTDGELALVDTRQIQIFGDGFCVLRDRIFFNLIWDGRMMHELGDDGRGARSFGEPPELAVAEGVVGVAREIVMEMWSSGRLFCDEASGTLLEVGISHPRAQLYDLDGTPRWTIELADLYFLLPNVSSDGRGVGYRQDEERGTHILRSVLPWRPGEILLQYSFAHPGAESGPVAAVESRLLTVADGGEVARTRSLPEFIAASGDRYVQIEREPFPRVLLVQRR
ncbi:MAG: hypothetical protein WEG36_05825 [Gemmatimonadota bacterium]